MKIIIVAVFVLLIINDVISLSAVRTKVATSAQPRKVARKNLSSSKNDHLLSPTTIKDVASKTKLPTTTPTPITPLTTAKTSLPAKRQHDSFLVMRGKALAHITTDLSAFYAETTDKFAALISTVEEFQLDPSVDQADDLNTELLAAKLAIMRTLQIVLQIFIKNLSELSLNGITEVQHEEIEKAVELLLEKGRSMYATIIETTDNILATLGESTILEKPAKSRVASLILTISNNKLQNLSNLLQQISTALQNKQNQQQNNNRLAVDTLITGIQRLDLIEMQVKNDLLLSALQAELETLSGADGSAVLEAENKDENNVLNWMNELQIF